jgi:hypothetical protein
MSGTQSVDLDLLAEQGVKSGKSWAIGCTPRELYLLAQYVQRVADCDPHRLAAVVYPDATQAQAVRNLWLGRWPVLLPIERSEAADAFVANFVSGALEVWRMMFERWGGSRPRPQSTQTPNHRDDAPPTDINRRNTTPIKSINLTTGEIRRFASVAAAVGEGFSRSRIYACLAGEAPEHKGCVWRKDEQPASDS